MIILVIKDFLDVLYYVFVLSHIDTFVKALELFHLKAGEMGVILSKHVVWERKKCRFEGK